MNNQCSFLAPRHEVIHAHSFLHAEDEENMQPELWFDSRN